MVHRSPYSDCCVQSFSYPFWPGSWLHRCGSWMWWLRMTHCHRGSAIWISEVPMQSWMDLLHCVCGNDGRPNIRLLQQLLRLSGRLSFSFPCTFVKGNECSFALRFSLTLLSKMTCSYDGRRWMVAWPDGTKIPISVVPIMIWNRVKMAQMKICHIWQFTYKIYYSEGSRGAFITQKRDSLLLGSLFDQISGQKFDFISTWPVSYTHLTLPTICSV